MFCERCGNELVDEAVVCTKCGCFVANNQQKAKKIENPKKEVVREKTVLPDEKVDYLLQTLVDRKQYERACAVAIVAYSGMRKSELLEMKVEFFNDEHFVYDSMWKTDKIRTKGFGKLGKQLNKFIEEIF